MGYKRISPQPVVEGGTGQATLTSHGVLLGQGTSGITTATSSTGGQLLQANAGDPTWTSSPSVPGSLTAGTTVTATSGAITATSGDIVATSGNIVITAATTSSVGNITQAGARIFHTFGTRNTFIGSSAGNYTLTTASCVNNVVIGSGIGTAGAGSGLTTSDRNVLIGDNCGTVLSTGSFNVMLGQSAGVLQTAGTSNTYLGRGAAQAVLTGSNNISIGYNSANAYTSSESSNIIIGNNGVISESNVIRIGTDGTGSGQQSTCFIAGALTQARGITSTSGNITATAGNFVASAGVISATNSSGTMLTLIQQASATTPAQIFLQKDRAGGVITTGDILGSIGFFGNDGSTYVTSSAIRSISTGTIATSRVAAQLQFFTHPDSTTADTLRMTIAETGAVTIAAPDSGTGLTISGGGLTVTGNVSSITTFGRTVGVSGVPVVVDNTGALGTVASSARYKENIQDIHDSRVMNLKPVTFNYKNDDSKTQQYGLIAEQVAEHMPELVIYNSKGEPETVQYHQMYALLLKEIQNLKKEIDALKKSA